jgi:hypothetical protein
MISWSEASRIAALAASKYHLLHDVKAAVGKPPQVA